MFAVRDTLILYILTSFNFLKESSLCCIVFIKSRFLVSSLTACISSGLFSDVAKRDCWSNLLLLGVLKISCKVRNENCVTQVIR